MDRQGNLSVFFFLEMYDIIIMNILCAISKIKEQRRIVWQHPVKSI